MEDTLTCPQCQNENAYFDGATYFCPDCDYKWDADGFVNGEPIEEESEE